MIALCISIYSNSAIRASINVFVFFVGMVASYYLYSNYIAGFFPRSYAMIWFGFTAVSPLLAFVCWYAKGKSKLAFILSALILAVLFNMCFVYGCWYFNAKSVLEVIVFIIGLIVLRRDTLRSSALMGTISIVLAVLLDIHYWINNFQFIRKHLGRTSKMACPSFSLSLLFMPLGAALHLLRLVGAECNIHAFADFLKL